MSKVLKKIKPQADNYAQTLVNCYCYCRCDMTMEASLASSGYSSQSIDYAEVSY